MSSLHYSSVSPDLDSSSSSWYISTAADMNPAFEDVLPESLPQQQQQLEQQLFQSVEMGESPLLNSLSSSMGGSTGAGLAENHEQPVKLGMLWETLAERDRNATQNAAKIDLFTGGFQIGSASWGNYLKGILINNTLI